MIAVLDTNVIISALLSSAGPPAETVQHWEQEQFELATSPVLLAELQETLTYARVQKYLKRSPAYIEAFLKRLSTTSIFVDPPFGLDVMADDPDDNRVLECALAAEAAYIVSGDSHLLDLKHYQGIEILPPAGFLIILK